MALEPFVKESDKLRGVARLFWDKLWPDLRAQLTRMDKAVVLGTVPCELPDGSLRNRAPILYDGNERFIQDKLQPHPVGESAFTPRR